MKRSLILLALFLSVSLHFHCRKEKHKDTGESQIQAKIDPSIITETDAAGNILSTPDPSDWTEDDVWKPDELAIMALPQASQLDNTTKASITMYPAYPNPMATEFQLAFKSTSQTLLQVVITDRFLIVKDRFFFTTQPGSNTLNFHLDPNKYVNNINYRVYYCFYSQADGAYYKGHGDIKIKR